MKLVKHEIEITHTQLAYLYDNQLEKIEELENSAFCDQCKYQLIGIS